VKKLVAFDDLAFYRSQSEIEALNEFRFSWNGTDYVLDLGEGNFADVTKYFTELANAATVLRVKAKPVGRAGPGKPRLGYLTEQGKHRYPDWLWDMYDAREEAHGLGSAGPDRRTADDSHRGGKG
jgi:hypothetical protein